MRDYGFGDVYDCRNVPGVEHFIIILGFQEIKGRKFVFYEMVTSRVYKAFKKLSDFFEQNCRGKCNKFKHNFKDTKPINNIGNLCSILFLDKNENFLDEDSMIVIKGEPVRAEATVLEKWITEDMAKPKVRISNVDIYKLIAILNNSDNISAPVANNIRASFNKVDRAIKDQLAKKALKKRKNRANGRKMDYLSSNLIKI